MVRRERVEAGGLHLDAQDAVLHERLRELGARAVELVAREQLTHVHGRFQGLGLTRLDRGAQQREVGDGCEVEAMEAHPVDAGVRAGAVRDDDVADLHLLGQCAARADANDRLHPVGVEQLVRVDRHRRLPHAGALHRDAVPLPGAGEAQHAPRLGVQLGIVEEGLGDPLRPQRVAGEQDDGGDLTGFCGDVGAHGVSVVSLIPVHPRARAR